MGRKLPKRSWVWATSWRTKWQRGSREDWQLGEGEVIPGKARKMPRKGAGQSWVCARTLFQPEFRMPVWAWQVQPLESLQGTCAERPLMPHHGDISAKDLNEPLSVTVSVLSSADMQDVLERHRSICMGGRRCGGFWGEAVSEDSEPLGHRNCDFLYLCLAHDKC